MSDLISRKEIIDRLERVIQNGLPSEDGMHPISAEAVLEVLKQLSEHGTNLASLGTDCISRQAAIDAVMECYDNDELFEVYEWKLNELPTIQPEPKRGKWIIKDDTERFIAQCNCCRYIEDSRRIKNFCPNCGADMRQK